MQNVGEAVSRQFSDLQPPFESVISSLCESLMILARYQQPHVDHELKVKH